MADNGTDRKEEEIGADAARDELTRMMGRAEHADARFIITKNGRPACALVGLKDLDRLRALDSEPQVAA